MIRVPIPFEAIFLVALLAACVGVTQAVVTLCMEPPSFLRAAAHTFIAATASAVCILIWKA